MTVFSVAIQCISLDKKKSETDSMALLQETAQAQQVAASVAASLHLPAADFLTLVDKSLPTALGLAGRNPENL